MQIDGQYKILEFYKKQYKENYRIGSHNRYDCRWQMYRPTAEQLIDAGYNIYSVIRLKDGKIFTIGNELFLEVDNKPYESLGRITKLWISVNQLRYDIQNMGGHLDMPVTLKEKEA